MSEYTELNLTPEEEELIAQWAKELENEPEMSNSEIEEIRKLCNKLFGYPENEESIEEIRKQWNKLFGYPENEESVETDISTYNKT